MVKIWKRRRMKMTILDKIFHLIVDLTSTAVDSLILQLRTIDFWMHLMG